MAGTEDMEPASAAPPEDEELLAAGIQARRQGDYARARPLLERVLERARGAGHTPVVASAVVQLAVITSLEGDTAAARVSAAQGLALYRALGDRRGEAEALSWLGQFDQLANSYSEARTNLDAALAIHRQLGDRPGEAGVLVRLGRLAGDTDDPEEAERLLRRAIDIQRAEGLERDLASSLANLGFNRYLVGSNDYNEGLFAEAVRIRRRLGDRRGEGTALVGLANALFLRNTPAPDLPRARAVGGQALELLRQVGVPYEQAWAAYVLAEIERQLSEFAAAQEHAELALSLYMGLGHDLAGNAYYTLAELARVREDMDTALSLAREALTRAHRLGVSLQVVRCLELVASIRRAQGRAELAAVLHGAAAELRQRLGMPLTAMQRRSVQADRYALEARMGRERFGAAVAEGRRLTLEAAVALALVGELPVSPAGGATRYRVRVLGHFSVQEGESGPEYKAAASVERLVKALAVLGTLHIDELAELLWPEEGPGIGRRRLHNVLSRARQVYGPLVVRSGEMFRLDPGTTVDLIAFVDAARRAVTALEAGSAEGLVLGRRAVELYGGELLPAERSDPWIDARRHETGLLWLRLLEPLSIAAWRADSAEEALSYLDLAAAADAYRETWLVQGAELCLERGWRARATGLLARATEVRRQLGLEPTPQMTRLRERLAS